MKIFTRRQLTKPQYQALVLVYLFGHEASLHAWTAYALYERGLLNILNNVTGEYSLTSEGMKLVADEIKSVYQDDDICPVCMTDLKN